MLEISPGEYGLVAALGAALIGLLGVVLRQYLKNNGRQNSQAAYDPDDVKAGNLPAHYWLTHLKGIEANLEGTSKLLAEAQHSHTLQTKALAHLEKQAKRTADILDKRLPAAGWWKANGP